MGAGPRNVGARGTRGRPPPARRRPTLARIPRCLVEDLSPESVLLGRDARHHLERVLRLRPGDPLELVDGRGGRATARLETDGRARVEARATPVAPPRDPVVLAVATPRLPRLEWLVEKAVELDVARLALLDTRRGERDVGAGRLARLARLADEALVQCRRPWRLELAAACPLGEVLAAHADLDVWLASPPDGGLDGPPAGDGPGGPAVGAAGSPRPDAAAGLAAPARAPDRGLLVLVGPEGGFDPGEERLALDAGAVRVRLGSTVLRVETAALALAVLAAERRGGPDR